MKHLLIFWALFLSLFLSNISNIFAVLPDEILGSPKLEARARALSSNLRCLVCQNETIDESSSPLARDLRLLIRERLVAGESDDEIIHFLTMRYGDFLLLNPPFNPKTALLWLSPFIILGTSLTVALWRIHRNRAPSLSEDFIEGQ